MAARQSDLPAGASRYGAQLGRNGRTMADVWRVDAGWKWCLQRMRLDAGGYDCQGAYWGTGDPLYWACVEHPPLFEGARSVAQEAFFRAPDRAAAKQHVRDHYDKLARFHR